MLMYLFSGGGFPMRDVELFVIGHPYEKLIL